MMFDLIWFKEFSFPFSLYELSVKDKKGTRLIIFDKNAFKFFKIKFNFLLLSFQVPKGKARKIFWAFNAANFNSNF